MQLHLLKIQLYVFAKIVLLDLNIVLSIYSLEIYFFITS